MPCSASYAYAVAVDVVALTVSVLSLLLAGTVLLRTELRWRAERSRDVRVVAWHDGVGMDFYADKDVIEQVIVVRIHNFGERPEHVVELGLQSASGERLANDRPTDGKMVDEPPPENRELPPRGQIGAKFKASADAIGEGFFGYAILGTGDRFYSDFVTADDGLGDIEAMVRGAVAEAASKGDLDDKEDH
jgi:hypothetical protein